jgi:sterol desaturase/sphingolipid hydroxylase (fatty acid hydroxylase superfamily)
LSATETATSGAVPPKRGLPPSSSPHGLIRWIRWWPVSFLLPIGLLYYFHAGGISYQGHVYSFEALGRAAGVGSLLGIKAAAAALLTELLSVGWAASSLRHMCLVRTASWWSDAGVTVMNNAHLDRMVAAVLSFGLVFFSFSWLHDVLARATGIQIGLRDLPMLPQFAVSFIIYTFLDYWDHRLVHMRVFWPLHRFHHAATEFYVFTSVRVHPGDVTSAFLMTGPLVLLGISPQVLLAVIIFRVYLGSIQHSQIPSDWGWFGRWVVFPPSGHRLHHMLDTSQPTCNFALIPVWDHLFGTWRGPYSQQVPIGVAAPYRHGAWFFSDLWRDYWEFLQEARAFFLRHRPGFKAVRE